jgi:hypothetical protein
LCRWSKFFSLAARRRSQFNSNANSTPNNTRAEMKR